MSIKILFDPLDEDAFEYGYQSNTLFFTSHIYFDIFPDYAKASVAIIGVPDFPALSEGVAPTYIANDIRKELYKMSFSMKEQSIVDLGNLRPGPTSEDTYRRLTEVVELLSDKGTLSIIIGKSQVYTLGQIKGLSHNSDLLNILIADAVMDMDTSLEATVEQSWLDHTLTHFAPKISEVVHLAHQSHLVNPEHTLTFDRLNFNQLRLGEIKSNTIIAEPYLRDAHVLSFDLQSLIGTEFKALKELRPFGLSPMEAVQLCWYAGHSQHLQTAGFYGYEQANDDGLSASIVATMIWYLIDARNYRIDDASFADSSNFRKFTFSFTDTEHITFYRSLKTGRWWFEVLADGMPTQYIACDLQDYQDASNGDIPTRYMRALLRLAE
ncbi:MAG: arginase family protein [Flexibacteraceae bacterium]